MARRHPSGSRSTGARRLRRPGAIAAASGLPSPYRLHDQDLERHLATGEHSALLAQYFGDDEYAHLGGLVARAALRPPVLQQLAAFDLAHSAEELAREVFRGFPSVYELLPAPGVAAGLDLHQLGNWPRAGLQPDGDLLRRAAGLHSVLAKPDRERFVVIAGVNQPTVTAISLQGDKFVFDTTPAGDGTVPLGFCELEDVPTYYIEEAHGALANNTAVGQAVVETLRQGTTTALPDHRPGGRTPRTIGATRARSGRDRTPFEQVVVGRRRQRRRDGVLSLLLVVNPTESLEGAEAEGRRLRTLFGAATPSSTRVLRPEAASCAPAGKS